MKLPGSMKMMPVKGCQSEGRRKKPPTEREYDVLLLAALHQLALPSHTNGPVFLKHDRRERFGRRTKESTTLLVLGGSLGK